MLRALRAWDLAWKSADPIGSLFVKIMVLGIPILLGIDLAIKFFGG